jgi:hypothetical protein
VTDNEIALAQQLIKWKLLFGEVDVCEGAQGFGWVHSSEPCMFSLTDISYLDTEVFGDDNDFKCVVLDSTPFSDLPRTCRISAQGDALLKKYYDFINQGDEK